MPTARTSGSTSSFRPCPEGAVQAALVDIIDLGKVTTTFNGETKTSHKVNFVWQVDERRDDGKRFHVAQRLTLSLHPKANLRRVVETLRGKKFTDEEAEAGFELDNLKGANALVTITHNQVGDRVYANITNVSPLMKGMQKMDLEAYERRAPKVQTTTADPDTDGTEDEIPF